MMNEDEVEDLLERAIKVFLFNQLCKAMEPPVGRDRERLICNELVQLGNELWPAATVQDDE